MKFLHKSYSSLNVDYLNPNRTKDIIVLYKQNNMEIDSVNLFIQVQALLKPLSRWMWLNYEKYNLILLMTEHLLVQQV